MMLLAANCEIVTNVHVYGLMLLVYATDYIFTIFAFVVEFRAPMDALTALSLVCGSVRHTLSPAQHYAIVISICC